MIEFIKGMLVAIWVSIFIIVGIMSKIACDEMERGFINHKFITKTGIGVIILILYSFFMLYVIY